MNIQDILKVLESREIGVNNHNNSNTIILQDTANAIEFCGETDGVATWDYYIRERHTPHLTFTSIPELEALLDKWYLSWPEAQILYRKQQELRDAARMMTGWSYAVLLNKIENGYEVVTMMELGDDCGINALRIRSVAGYSTPTCIPIMRIMAMSAQSKADMQHFIDNMVAIGKIDSLIKVAPKLKP